MAETRRIIGLAGPIASGKNLVASFLEKEGYSVIDVDKIGHIALENSKAEILSLFKSIAQQQNLQLIDESGNINRRNLVKIVLSKKEYLQKHESILHPKMDVLIKQTLEENPNQNFVINAAILHKFKAITRCNVILFVTANPFLRYKRAKQRSNLSKMQFFKFFLAQIEIYPKCKKLNADIYRVDNSDTQEQLVHNIRSILDSCF